jgi:FixJ family two-component response regulator
VSDGAIVYIVDDDPSFGRALGRLLSAHGLQARTFASGVEFLSHVTPASRGCVLTDLDMPGLGGLEVQQRLAESRIGLPVVFLTGRGDIPNSVRAMRQGAADFLEKRAPEADLLAAVRRALAADAAHSGLRSRFAHLTERELEVLRHVVRGRMNKQIAADLGIHERTVTLHRSAITTKLGVRSAAELTSLVREANLPLNLP